MQDNAICRVPTRDHRGVVVGLKHCAQTGLNRWNKSRKRGLSESLSTLLGAIRGAWYYRMDGL